MLLAPIRIPLISFDSQPTDLETRTGIVRISLMAVEAADSILRWPCLASPVRHVEWRTRVVHGVLRRLYSDSWLGGNGYSFM